MASKTTNFPDKKISSLILRKDFSKVFIPASFEQSEFLEINKTAYKNFLEKEIKNLVLSQFPVANPKNTKYEVRCGGVSFTKPLFSIKDSLEQGKSYEASLFADIYIVNNETGEIIKNKKTKSNISSGVFLTNIPLMTDSGTFIINGIEKNVVNQLVKAAGLYAFENAQIRLLKKKKVIETNNCEILPSHGTLMHFHITGKAENEKILLVSMRSLNGESIVTIPVTILLKAMGMSEKNIADVYAGSTVIQNTLAFDKYNDTKIFNDKYYLEIKNNIIKNGFENSLTGSPLEIKLKNLVNEVIKNEKSKKIDSIITELAARYIIEELGISTKAVDFGGTSEKICYQDVLCRNFFDSKYYSLSNAGRYKIIHKSRLTERLYSNTLAQDIVTKDGKVLLKKDQLVLIEELNIIKKALANGDLNFSKQIPINEPCSFQKKSNSIYETIAIYKNNSKQIFNIISVNNTIETTALTTQDLLSAISYTLGLEYGIGNYDDTEDLSNKRLRLVDEQFKKHFSKGLSRIVKFTFEKLASLYLVTAKGLTKEKLEQKVNLRNIVNTKVLQLAVKNFFNTYDLTQFVDQTNPLSELTNKRRISSLGEGGVSREDPNLSIRDIHFTHYGRICPIETPEGANVGLILSLAIYAKVDTNGFILTPYKKVIDGVITDEIEYLTATKEYDYVVASSRTKTDDKGKIIEEVVEGRFHQTNKFFKPKEVNYVDIIPSQILSPSTASVPFIESDDGVRVAYGSNFQRQALPLIEPYAATIGTGFEAKIAADSGFSIVAGEDGEIKYVDSSKIVVITEDKSLKTYELTKYARSNQSTSINQTPIVYVGQKIAKGDLLADGPAIKNGEIALGINPLVAFMHWKGFNYEDGVVISDRLYKNDLLTSIAFETYEVECIQTKNGDEEITREVMNVPDDKKRNLDEDGYIVVGAEVKEGDILVGKITPRGQVDLSPEEELMQQLFGTKTKNYKDTSLRVPHGAEGTIVSVKKMNIAEGYLLNSEVIEKVIVTIAQKKKIEIGDKLANRHGNKGVISLIIPEADMPFMEDGTPVDIIFNSAGVPGRMNIGQISEMHLGFAMRELAKKKFLEIVNSKGSVEDLVQLFGIKYEKANILVKSAKEYIKQMKSEVASADLYAILKTAGLKIEDLNYKAISPAFNGATINDIIAVQAEAGLNPIENKGKVTLYDGQTGEQYDGKIAVGVLHVLKLNHMVADKLHARAIGPYSKITQQPLGGKAQNGGQRMGEMEVWALEAYGAAYNLREMLTIKSDDVKGRNMAYSSIIKKMPFPEPRTPESFKLLTKYLQGLGIGMEIEFSDKSVQDVNEYVSTIKSDENTNEGGIIK